MRTEIFFVGNDQESRKPKSFNQNQPLKIIEKRNEKSIKWEWTYEKHNEHSMKILEHNWKVLENTWKIIENAKNIEEAMFQAMWVGTWLGAVLKMV